MIFKKKFNQKEARKATNKRGFTMLELIGAMIIIAVLTVAGITAIATAINNSRMSATQTDLAGFQLPIEQCLLENPKLERDTNVINVATTINKYLEGEMKLVKSDAEGSVTANGDKASDWRVHRNDPWGNSYRIFIDLNNSANNGLRVFIVSSGKDGKAPVMDTATLNKALNKDDMFMMIQLKDGHVSHGMYGMRNGNATGVDGAVGIGGKLTDMTGVYLDNGVMRMPAASTPGK